MKKYIISLCCLNMVLLANFGNAQNNPDQCVQTITPSSGGGGGEGTGGQSSSGCVSHAFWSCTGQCTGLQPASGTTCTACAAVENNADACTPGNTPITCTQVTASCTGYAACGCGSNWTAVTPPSTGTLMCGATGDAC